MFDWMTNNSKLLLVLTSIGSLLVWLVYASLLYKGFQRQRRSRVLINHGRGLDAEALCIICNMSAESVCILNIIAELKTSDGLVIADVTDQETDCNPEDTDLGQSTRQGPLASGGYFHIGSFSNMVSKLSRMGETSPEHCGSVREPELQRLTMRVIGIYGPENLPIGAKRDFALNLENGKHTLTPESWDTAQLRTGRQRRGLKHMLKQLNERLPDNPVRR